MCWDSMFTSFSTYFALFATILVPVVVTVPAEPAWKSGSSNVLSADAGRNVSRSLFAEFEELSRVVDISYCVGTTGIQEPFQCLGRCGDFEGFRLVQTWNTGPLMSDSCGYIAIDNSKSRFRNADGRIIVAFRGTYSIASTIADLSTIPQEYVPYPTDPDNNKEEDPPSHGWLPHFKFPWSRHRSGHEARAAKDKTAPKCDNCTVHYGFYTSFVNTRPVILPLIENLRTAYPTYELHLVGHSLGGAVALLSGLEYQTLGWDPIITTYGEPKVGNVEFRTFVDKVFNLDPTSMSDTESFRYRRLTHVEDPVPLLPLTEWGYRPHAGEVYISKQYLPPSLSDLEHCDGDEDKECSAGSDTSIEPTTLLDQLTQEEASIFDQILLNPDVTVDQHLDLKRDLPFDLNSRYKLWQLFFAHRDYFWRLGLCVPGGVPLDRDWNWGRNGKSRYHDETIDDAEQ